MQLFLMKYCYVAEGGLYTALLNVSAASAAGAWAMAEQFLTDAHERFEMESYSLLMGTALRPFFGESQVLDDCIFDLSSTNL